MALHDNADTEFQNARHLSGVGDVPHAWSFFLFIYLFIFFLPGADQDRTVTNKYHSP